MITYQQEPLHKVIHEINNLLYLDWQEVGRLEELYPLEPDWELYQIIEDNGSLRIFTARDSSKLIGYFTVVSSPSLHSKGKLIASNDVIFLHPAYRKGFVGVKLFKFAEKCIKEDGFQQLQVSYTEKFDISPILSMLGYTKVETKFEKRLN